MKNNHLKKIINKQFRIAGLELSFDDIVDQKVPNWFQKYTCTQEQNDKWQNWLLKYLKTNLNLSKDRAVIETAWINLNYGLKIKRIKSEKKSTRKSASKSL